MDWVVFHATSVIQSIANIWMILMLVLMTYSRCCSTNQEINNQDPFGNNKISYFSDSITITMLLCYVLNGMFADMNNFRILNNQTIISCDIIQKIIFCSWYYCRALLYGVMISRIMLAFHASIYKYSTFCISILFTIVISFVVLSTVLIIIYVDGIWGDNVSYPPNYCISVVPYFLLLYQMSFDFIISTVLLWMFISPLVRIISIRNKYDQGFTDTEDQFFGLVVKYTNLAVLCIITTMLGTILIIIANVYILITIDNIINTTCCVLLSELYRNAYITVCKCCHKGFRRLCLILFERHSNYVELENDVSKKSVQ
eukprot:19933_1